MSRDFDPPVRERDAVPPATRRGSRRDPAPVNPYEDADPFPPSGSRVMRDEHRPRRGTLPDRRMLRRDTPIDYSAEFSEETGASAGPERRPGAVDGASSAASRDDSGSRTTIDHADSGIGGAQSIGRGVSGRGGDGAFSPVETAAAGLRESVSEWADPGARAGDSGPSVSASGSDASGREPTKSEPTGPDRRGRSGPDQVGTGSKRRLPALPALEPGVGEHGSAGAALGSASEMSDGGASTGRDLAVRGEATPGDALRATAGPLEESAAATAGGVSGTERSERVLDKRSGRSAATRGTEPTEGDRMDRKRGRETAVDGDPARAERPRGERRAEGDTRPERRSGGVDSKRDRRDGGSDARRDLRGTEAGRERRAADAEAARRSADGVAERDRPGADGVSGRDRRGADGAVGRDRRGAEGEARRDRRGADGEARRDRRGADGEARRDRRGAEGDAGRGRRRAEGDPGRRGDAERDARRGKGSEGRGRSTDADRVHLGGRAGTPGRARPRPDGEAGERPVRNRPARGARPERVGSEERGRGGARKDKWDKAAEQAEREAAAKRAAARKAAAKKKQSGPRLLDDTMRAKLEVTAREGNGIKAAWATFRLHTDDLRRRNFAARAERIEYGSFDEFDRTTAQLTDRGYIGAGGGRMNVIGRPVEYRATTAQVAGLWPWSVGAGAPLIGTPLGSHLHTGAPVCFDPMNWFMRGSFITAPSLFVLGLNGFGKSSLVRRIVLGGVAQGITPLILADVKPDYRKLVELVGGQVIDLGYGHGKLNPLAAGVLGSIVPLLDDFPELQTQVMQEMRARQVTLVAGLVELVRGERVRDFEETLISTSLRILYRDGSLFTPENPPIMEDLLDVVVAGGDELRLDAGADDTEEYAEAIKELRRSLRALTQGPFGAIFNGRTTTPIDTTATAVCIDVSHIPTGDKKLKAAVMLACWADGFASVEAAHVLADADLGPQRYFQVVMDELWQVLGLGDFMVDRVDELTRLQRGIATSLIMISHTIKDLQALGSEAAIAKALGFLERARAKIFGALPAEEIARLDSTVPFTAAEEDMVTSWSAPQALTGEALKPGQQRPPAPGTGKFLLKIGEDRRPGIPFQMEFTPSERESGIHDTNQRFSEFTETTATRGSGSGSDEGSAA
ncbi:hypothetical protein [Nocardia tengchongensis]|uniref:hypothetical protein n=1 Tax=Nocardia tengchongensis TaxID=2055889 RepID=UPI0036998B88